MFQHGTLRVPIILYSNLVFMVCNETFVNIEEWNIFCLLVLSLFILRERVCKWGRGRERIPSSLRTVSMEPYVGS